MVGLFAFFYAVLHFGIYVADQTVFAGQGLSLALVVEDVAKRPYITVGFTAFLLLIPLALTSTKGWIRRLGGKRWQAVHRLVYVSASLGVLHFLWLVKADVRRPVMYGIAVVVLLAARLWRARRRPAPAPAAAVRSELAHGLEAARGRV
jgi:sulfoxide reductase heme-binding subunit YedZ